MITIYADTLFLLNTLVDYLLLLVTGRIAGIPLYRKRYLLAAVLGGGYAVLTVIPCLHSILTSIPSKFLVLLFLCVIAYGRSYQLIKLMLLFGGTSCSLAGVVLAMASTFHTNHFIAIQLLLPVGVIFFLLGNHFFRSSMQHNVSDNLFQTKLSIAGNTTELTTLLDTGNHLKNPLTGQPILVVSIHILDSILPTSLYQLLIQSDLKNPSALPELIRTVAPTLNPQLIPYRSLGCASGLLLTLQTDWVQIKSHLYKNATVALAPTDLGFGYSALWGGELKGESDDL